MLAIPQPPPAIAFYDNNFHKSKISYRNDTLVIQQLSEETKKRIKYIDKFSELLCDSQTNLTKSIVDKLASFLVLTQSDKITFEKTPENSFLIKASLDVKDYFLAIYFDNEVPNGYECFLNVYKDKKYVSDFHGELDTVFLKLLNC